MCIELETVCFAVTLVSRIIVIVVIMDLRDHEAVLVCSQEAELQRMADAARPMDGCNVGHVDGGGGVQLREAIVRDAGPAGTRYHKRGQERGSEVSNSVSV